jgi:hypothetical protein
MDRYFDAQILKSLLHNNNNNDSNNMYIYIGSLL